MKRALNGFSLGALALAALLGAGSPALSQDKGSVNPKPLPPLANPGDPKTPAKQLFGRKTEPTDSAPRSIGFYSKGCLAGGEALPVNGDAWQVMRLSRNRNWGHPALIAVMERIARQAKIGQHVAHDALGFAGRVGLRVVEEVDAAIVSERDHVACLRSPDAIAERDPRAERKRREFEARRAEAAVFHREARCRQDFALCDRGMPTASPIEGHPERLA